GRREGCVRFSGRGDAARANGVVSSKDVGPHRAIGSVRGGLESLLAVDRAGAEELFPAVRIGKGYPAAVQMLPGQGARCGITLQQVPSVPAVVASTECGPTWLEFQLAIPELAVPDEAAALVRIVRNHNGYSSQLIVEDRPPVEQRQGIRPGCGADPRPEHESAVILGIATKRIVRTQEPKDRAISRIHGRVRMYPTPTLPRIDVRGDQLEALAHERTLDHIAVQLAPQAVRLAVAHDQDTALEPRPEIKIEGSVSDVAGVHDAAVAQRSKRDHDGLTARLVVDHLNSQERTQGIGSRLTVDGDP